MRSGCSIYSMPIRKIVKCPVYYAKKRDMILEIVRNGTPLIRFRCARDIYVNYRLSAPHLPSPATIPQPFVPREHIVSLFSNIFP